MSMDAVSEPAGAASPSYPDSTHETLPTISASEAEERGRLKRRRRSSLSPRRASSPSRGHDRTSGSRHREHHRKHHRACSPGSSTSPPTVTQKKTRRRSDAEPDHTFRGRVRNRSSSNHRTRSPITQGEGDDDERLRSVRRRSQPPSRHKIEEEDEGAELRRQRSYHKLSGARRDSKGENMGPADKTEAAQGGATHIEQLV